MTLRLAALTLLLAPLTLAQTPAAKPANATGQCKDGSYSTAASKSGACRGHNGVRDWYTASTPSAVSAPASNARLANPSTTPAQTAQPANAASPKSSSSTSTKIGPKANLANTPQAPGGGPGLVWVNSSSNVYHCPGTDFYGKTKAGAYMSESDAKAKGARPDHGNTCTK